MARSPALLAEVIVSNTMGMSVTFFSVVGTSLGEARFSHAMRNELLKSSEQA